MPRLANRSRDASSPCAKAGSPAEAQLCLGILRSSQCGGRRTAECSAGRGQRRRWRIGVILGLGVVLVLVLVLVRLLLLPNQLGAAGLHVDFGHHDE